MESSKLKLKKSNFSNNVAPPALQQYADLDKHPTMEFFLKKCIKHTYFDWNILRSWTCYWYLWKLGQHAKKRKINPQKRNAHILWKMRDCQPAFASPGRRWVRHKCDYLKWKGECAFQIQKIWPIFSTQLFRPKFNLAIIIFSTEDYFTQKWVCP